MKPIQEYRAGVEYILLRISHSCVFKNKVLLFRMNNTVCQGLIYMTKNIVFDALVILLITI